MTRRTVLILWWVLPPLIAMAIAYTASRLISPWTWFVTLPAAWFIGSWAGRHSSRIRRETDATSDP